MPIIRTNNISIDKVVSIENVSKNFGDIQAVKDITFSVEKSHTLGLLGSNGAGKTTTIGILTGLVNITSGSASIMGFDSVNE